jgi:hypothetical protein
MDRTWHLQTKLDIFHSHWWHISLATSTHTATIVLQDLFFRIVLATCQVPCQVGEAIWLPGNALGVDPSNNIPNRSKLNEHTWNSAMVTHLELVHELPDSNPTGANFFVFPIVFVFIIFLFLYVHLFARFLIGILLLNKFIQFQISYYICFPIIVLND